MPLIDLFAPNLGTGRSSYMRLGTTTARCATIMFTRSSTTTGQVSLSVQSDSVSNSLTIYTDPATPAVLSCGLNVSTSITTPLLNTDAISIVTGYPWILTS